MAHVYVVLRYVLLLTDRAVVQESKKMNYARFINRLSARRQPSIIRELNRPFPPDFVLFTAGKPNPALFPFTKATFETDDGKKLVFEGAVMKEALQYQNSLV